MPERGVFLEDIELCVFFQQSFVLMNVSNVTTSSGQSVGRPAGRPVDALELSFKRVDLKQ